MTGDWWADAMRTRAALLGLPLLAMLLSLSLSPAAGRTLKEASSAPGVPFLLRVLKGVPFSPLCPASALLYSLNGMLVSRQKHMPLVVSFQVYGPL